MPTWRPAASSLFRSLPSQRQLRAWGTMPIHFRCSSSLLSRFYVRNIIIFDLFGQSFQYFDFVILQGYGCLPVKEIAQELLRCDAVTVCDEAHRPPRPRTILQVILFSVPFYSCFYLMQNYTGTRRNTVTISGGSVPFLRKLGRELHREIKKVCHVSVTAHPACRLFFR